MATYIELLSASQNPNLLDKIKVACIIAAETIRTESAVTANHANRLTWAKSVFADPGKASTQMLWAVLAQNQAALLNQIISVSDATLQAAVNTAVDVFADGVI